MIPEFIDTWQMTEPGKLLKTRIPTPTLAAGEALVKIAGCGVCHTELDEIEGRTPPPALPIVPGHQVTGRVERRGRSARIFKPGERVGVGWIYSACGTCL